MLLQHSCHTTPLTIILFDCSLVTDKLRTQDVHGAGDALSSALFMATMFGLMIQAVLLVMNMSDAAAHVRSRYKYSLANFVSVLQCYSHQMVVFTGAAPALIAPSVTYLKIRAWSAPAVLISMVAQVGVSALYLHNAPNICDHVAYELFTTIMLRTRLSLQLFAQCVYYLAYLLICNMPCEYTFRTTTSLCKPKHASSKTFCDTVAVPLSALCHAKNIQRMDCELLPCS